MTPIPAARPAVTTIVFRRDDSAEPYDYRVLFIRRPPSLKTFGGSYAYPGGTLQPSDGDVRAITRCRGLTSEQASAFLTRGAGIDWDVGDRARWAAGPNGEAPFEPPALAFWVAAARELFEEVGVLIAAGDDGDPLIPAEMDRQHLLARRHQLLAGTTSFLEILEEEGWYLPAARFTYLFRIVTPTFVARRFDTRFFLVELPAGQELAPNPHEVDDVRWLNPDEALRRVAADILRTEGPPEFPLPSPTIFTVTTLHRHRRIDELLRALVDGYTIR
ncbi:MAG TPA: hypothetical protein VIL95_08885 [Bacillota bacterium]